MLFFAPSLVKFHERGSTIEGLFGRISLFLSKKCGNINALPFSEENVRVIIKWGILSGFC